MREELYSNELNKIISYMVEVLSEEFPTDVFTPEYLITSMLDNTKCHVRCFYFCCCHNLLIIYVCLLYMRYIH